MLNQWIVVDNHPTDEQKVYTYGKDPVEKGNNYWLLNPLRVGKQFDNNGEILPKAIENKDESILETVDQKRVMHAPCNTLKAIQACGGSI